MATTCFFDKVIRDQKYGVAGDMREHAEISLDFGRSSFYSGYPDAIYICVNGKS